ncbi:MAG: hypothetical protein CMM37_13335 [Rhodospirillaceae bacterium]|nr:hypothetical protein [Rhodospirillaceae bacterium]|tara:strand:+ start:392 stop:889 length:498 start_codon:yes stop_codon:yes gene_type:complete
MILTRYLIIVLFLGSIYAQDQSELSPVFSDYQISSERYLTDENGNIMMYINIWGHVAKPGHVMVYEGIDMASLLSYVGGPIKGADLKNVKLFREVPDKDGRIAYNLDFNNFIERGDRSDFIELKPNDTIIFPQTNFNYFISHVGTFNTFLGLLNLYLQVSRSFAD